MARTVLELCNVALRAPERLAPVRYSPFGLARDVFAAASERLLNLRDHLMQIAQNLFYIRHHS